MDKITTVYHSFLYSPFCPRCLTPVKSLVETMKYNPKWTKRFKVLNQYSPFYCEKKLMDSCIGRVVSVFHY